MSAGGVRIVSLTKWAEVADNDRQVLCEMWYESVTNPYIVARDLTVFYESLSPYKKIYHN